MMDNFNQPGLANFSGALVTNNTIDCGTRCHYGIEVGPRPWYTACECNIAVSCLVCHRLALHLTQHYYLQRQSSGQRRLLAT